MSTKNHWKKILYEDQGVPDNYVDDSFLEEMKKNLYIRTYDFWTVVRGSAVVTQQIYSVCIFVAVYVYMYNDALSPQWLFYGSLFMMIVGYLINFALNAHAAPGSATFRYDDITSMCVFLLFGYGLSPILMTLTKTVSTDTIYAMTSFMLLVNLLFHDYEASSSTAVVSRSVSFNAGIFASVCLASRLPTTWHAFSTVTFAVQIFALWPVLLRTLKNHVPASQTFLNVALGLAVAVLMATVSTVGCLLFILLHLFISFVCPAWLIRLQPYKNNIYGPWDEAVIKQ
jgi:phosphatidylinositol glycan class C protein